MISQVLGLDPEVYKVFQDEELGSPGASKKYSERLIQGIKLKTYLPSYDAIACNLHAQNNNECFDIYTPITNMYCALLVFFPY